MMAKASLPPGFRFHPTDIELVCYYLKRKIMGKALQFEGISQIDIYKFAPWDLPEKSSIQSKDLEWYFFCPGDRKYANGLRKNRATDIGYWKTTGKDRSISYNSQTVAMRKTLVFHLGRAPKGVRTDWVMHEYRLEDKNLAAAGFLQDAYVLCRIFKKSGLGPKNGEQYGAPFEEEDWEDDKVNVSSVLVPSTSDKSINFQHNLLDHALQSDAHAVGNLPDDSPEYFNVDGLLQQLSEDNNNNTSVVQENNGNETPNLVAPFQTPTVANEVTTSDGNGIFDGLEDLYTQFELKSPEERILLHTKLGTGDGAYMEIKDFLFPVEGHCSELMDPGDLFGQNSSQSLSSTNIPTFLSGINTSSSGMEGSSGNAGGQHLADFHGSSSCETTDEIGHTQSIQSSAGGEPYTLPSESLITNQAKYNAKLRQLFSSIRGRPALAAEYPSALKEEKLGGGVSYYRSSIHVNAEVTLQCPCTEDSQLNASSDLVSASSGKHIPSRKIPGETYLSGSGFAFVFFLGVVSALMWIFLLALGVKVGKSAWKLFLAL